jgi:GWxTD domain-containing protein
MECIPIVVGILALFWVTACSGRRSTPRASPLSRNAGGLTMLDATALYRRAGLIAGSGPVGFVGALGFFAGPRPDSTLSLLTLSLPTRSLTFARDGDRYRAGYTVSADLRQGGSIAHHFDAKETVRVATFGETSRTEESVIFQEYFDLAPGIYSLSVTVQDDVGSRKGEFEGEVTVPAAGSRGISSSLSVHEATPRTSVDSVPNIVTSPRSTAVFGRDSTIAAYVEAYELPPGQVVNAAVRGEHGATLWSERVRLSENSSVASGVVHVPVSPLGIGAVELVIWRSDGTDTTRTPFFVSFGEELPVASFDDMLLYLRYYAAHHWLEALRDTTPADRAEAWARFLRETDPEPTTSHHEGLQAYFGRIQYANQAYRDDGPGWLSDRGKVYVALGEPDRVEMSVRNMNQRGQAQFWLYQRIPLQLVFIDQTGFNRWRLTSASEAEFQNALQRELSR